MTASLTDVRGRALAAPESAEAPAERWVRRRVGIAWALLTVNVLTYYSATWSGAPLVIPIPSPVGKIITQGAMPAALLLALTVNRRLLVYPSFYLCILTLLVVIAFMVMIEAGHLGTFYRTFRFAGFVATLWLLTPWWGRRDMLLVRCYLWTVSVVLAIVVLGLAMSPSAALAQGRLAGTLWPFPPTQVAHFAAVTTGLVILLWLCGLLSGRLALLAAAVGGVIVLLTHTRTALLAMLAGILVGGLSLFKTKARVRRLFAAAGVIISVAAMTLSGVIATFLVRGEDSQQLTSLTGRTDVWHAILTEPRNEFQKLFGFGVSNLSFNGLSIDSNWVGTYFDLGLVGAILTGVLLLFVLVNAYFQPLGPPRALALFLVTYCLISSFTETGLSAPSLYMIELTLAASLLVPTTQQIPP
jgi:O-antigen ligase